MDNLNETSKKLSLTDLNIIKSKLSVDLKEHQKTIIRTMLELEQNNNVSIDIDCVLYRGHIYTEKDVTERSLSWYLRDRFGDNIKYESEKFNIKLNFGILADQVGAGKTFEIVGLICHTLIPKNHPKILPASIYSVVEYTEKIKTERTNIIIVPHNLVTQWKNVLELTKLNVFVVNLKKTVNDIKIVNNNIDHDVIILSCTMIDVFNEKFTSYKWSRIIIDEITSIKLPVSFEMKCNFLWYVTATPSGLKWIRRNYIRETIVGIDRHIFNKIIIKNNEDYVAQSMKLPDINKVIIHCDTPSGFKMIKDYISKDILNMLNAGNIKEAASKLNCNIDTDENILKIITKNIETSLHNKKAELVYLKTTIVTDQKTHNENIKKIEENINSLNVRLSSITEKINSMNTETCPICLDDVNLPTILQCCNNVFCAGCISSVRSNKCPMCRSGFTIKDLNIINNDISKSPVNNKKLLSKKNNLLNLIKSKPSGKFLIFSNYENTNDNISAFLTDNKINHSKLLGTMACINKTIERFKNGTKSVLLLNARFFGSGLNLEMATDVVIYHEMNLEFETQVIGRAQRFGRTSQLNLYYLLHDNEQSNCKNPSLNLNIYDDEDENIIN